MKLIRIGRGEGNDVRIADQSVSRRHAELIIARGGRLYLTDCASSGGTFVSRNGDWVRIRQDYVEANERVRFGAHEIAVRTLST